MMGKTTMTDDKMDAKTVSQLKKADKPSVYGVDVSLAHKGQKPNDRYKKSNFIAHEVLKRLKEDEKALIKKVRLSTNGYVVLTLSENDSLKDACSKVLEWDEKIGEEFKVFKMKRRRSSYLENALKIGIAPTKDFEDGDISWN